MMSAGSGSSAGAAENYYYSKDPLFTEGGQWLGKGAEALNLAGTVTKEDFSHALRGQNKDGEQLVAIKHGSDVEDRRAGNDFTFSAPKSVSIAMAAGVEGMKAAHDAAVKATVEHMESHYSQARTPAGVESTGNLLAAKFDHSTSRAGDPQLHSHVFICNATQDKSGAWKANEPKNIFRDQKAIGELYRQELAHQLQKQGHELAWSDRGSLQFELASVKPEVIQQFSQRREMIEQKVAEWKAEGKFEGAKDAKLFEMANLDTRQNKDKSITLESSQTQWQQGFREAGTSKEEVAAGIVSGQQQNLQQASADKDKSAAIDSNKPTAEAVVAEAARIQAQSEAVLDRSQILQTAARISGGRHDVKSLSSAVETQAERLGEDDKGRQKYTTSEIRGIEKSNSERLDNMGEFRSVTSMEEVQKYLDKLEKEEGIQLKPGQQQMIKNELAGKGGFAVVQGDPGTGKTFASSIVERFNEEVLKKSGRESYTLNVAFTGKAASEMSAASGKPAFTIDSFLNGYNSGKIGVANSARVESKDNAVMQREEGVNSFANHHHSRAEASLPDSHFAKLTIGDRRSHDPLNPGQTSISIGKNGVRLEFSKEKEGLLQNKETRSVYAGDGSKSSYTGTKSGDSYYHQRQGKTTTIDKRGNEVKTTSKSSGSQFLGYTKSEKTEKGADYIKTTKSTTWGRTTKGVTKTIARNGEVTETAWEGKRGLFSGRFEITSSNTSRYEDKAQAEKEFTSGTVKFGMAVDAIKDKIAVWFGGKKTAEPAISISNHKEPGQAQTTPLPSTDKGLQPSASGGKPPKIAIPAGAQVILKIDEASFVGARQAAQLLNVVDDLKEKGVEVKIEAIGDTKQSQALSAGDFLKQAQQKAEQGKGDFSALKEINRQKNPELLKVAMKLNEDGTDKQKGQNAAEALQMLKEQGRITEVKGDRADLIRETVKRYMSESSKRSNDPEKAAKGEKQSTLITVGLNADRKEINRQIRESRIEAGEIKRGSSFNISTPAQTNESASSYKPGLEVSFTGERDAAGHQRAWGMRLGATATVQSVDQKNNTVRVVQEYQKDGKTCHATKDFKAEEMHGRVSVSQKEERSFSVGDRVVFGKNDKLAVDVKNGQTGTITAIDDKGKITVEMDGDKKESKSFNLGSYNHLDHGYAVTIEKSQGATIESVINFMPAEGGKGQNSYNDLNVGFTRCKNEAHIITDSVEKLAEQVSGVVDSKTSTLNPLNPNKSLDKSEEVREAVKDFQKESLSLKEESKLEEKDKPTPVEDAVKSLKEEISESLKESSSSSSKENSQGNSQGRDDKSPDNNKHDDKGDKGKDGDSKGGHEGQEQQQEMDGP